MPKTIAPPSRRQAHKLETKRMLQQAALDLFAKLGYDETTTEAIAEKAGVSPRTFFRYFPTKESVLFVGESDWFQTFADEYVNQPLSLSDVDALRTTFVSLGPGWVKIRRSLLLYERAVASSPTLRGVVHDRQQNDITRLAEAIAKRGGRSRPDERCYLLAAIGLVSHRRVLTKWLAGPATANVAELVAAEFDILTGLFETASANGRRTKAS